MSALVFALPSKGRLREQAIAFLADAGLHLDRSRGARDYTASFVGVNDVAVTLLSAGEIADELHAGRIHMGITGQDLLHEHGAGERVVAIESLGFGRANVVVAVPRAWIDVSTMADLDDVASGFRLAHHRRLRVATKYVNTAREHFAAKGVHVDLIRLYGSMELAPLVGLADAIVDLVSTGRTLRANGLVAVEEIMPVSARLIVNQAALKTKRATLQPLIDAFSKAAAR